MKTLNGESSSSSSFEREREREKEREKIFVELFIGGKKVFVVVEKRENNCVCIFFLYLFVLLSFLRHSKELSNSLC